MHNCLQIQNKKTLYYEKEVEGLYGGGFFWLQLPLLYFAKNIFMKKKILCREAALRAECEECSLSILLKTVF